MGELASAADIASIPKVELHIHLQGSITEPTASTLARRHGADPAAAGLVDGRYPDPYPDFEGFLETYLAANQFVSTPDDLELVAVEFVRHQASQNVRYSEVMFTASICARNGMEPRAMWKALRSGFSAAGADTRVGIIVDAIRDFGSEEADLTLRLVDGADAPIVALALTGIEGTVPLQEFIAYRQEARRLGMGFHIHAGEMGPPSSMAESLDVLEVDRIGHGVAAIRDPVLLERLIRDRVPIENCPTANVGIGLFPSLDAHPFASYWRAGVNVTLSSDDPAFFHTTLNEELQNMVRIARLTREDLAELQRRAARDAFAQPVLKEALIAEIDAWAAGR